MLNTGVKTTKKNFTAKIGDIFEVNTEHISTYIHGKFHPHNNFNFINIKCYQMLKKDGILFPASLITALIYWKKFARFSDIKKVLYRKLLMLCREFQTWNPVNPPEGTRLVSDSIRMFSFSTNLSISLFLFCLHIVI